ncbi:hypothetical protein DES53_111117 [Roseimicrobium gellanilyticum]|uniref:Uncharacterized protein n=1 Tax=Roseimicrobium gellanilyticum TaxID=748857 RepID=A0A366H8P5_9BACT|nr:hypothetical protein [Roseimicrobium gellanilyticum]RBP38598.1 hypothetical protein DES53_111117 [Roseimicrobium gellanilyticum]
MKRHIITTLLTLALGFTLSAADKDKHDHDHGAKAGPTGGKLITEIEPHAEFFVNKDKKVEIRFVDDDNKVVPPAAQTVNVTLGDRSAPTKLTFTKEGDKLISDKAIPAGNDLPTVVQIKATPDAKSVTEKFNLNLNDCPTCKNKEYACTCEHGDDHKHEKK